jgi:hypothetical protein
MNPERQNLSSNEDAQERELNELKQWKHLLRQSIPPLASEQLEPRSNLWPQLRARIESQSTANRTEPSSRDFTHVNIPIPWFDWGLAALAVAALIIFPGIIPALLYHF